MLKHIFANISAQGASFFKPIFAYSKTLNCGKTGPDWAKRLVIQVSVTPNRVESGEISQAAKLLFPSVISPGAKILTFTPLDDLLHFLTFKR